MQVGDDQFWVRILNIEAEISQSKRKLFLSISFCRRTVVLVNDVSWEGFKSDFDDKGELSLESCQVRDFFNISWVGCDWRWLRVVFREGQGHCKNLCVGVGDQISKISALSVHRTSRVQVWIHPRKFEGYGWLSQSVSSFEDCLLISVPRP